MKQSARRLGLVLLGGLVGIGLGLIFLEPRTQETPDPADTARAYIDALVEGDKATLRRLVVHGLEGPSTESLEMTHEQNRLSKDYQLRSVDGGYEATLRGVSRDGVARLSVHVRLVLARIGGAWLVEHFEMELGEVASLEEEAASSIDRPAGASDDAELRFAVSESLGDSVVVILRTVEHAGLTIALATTADGSHIVALDRHAGHWRVVATARGTDPATAPTGSPAFLLTALTLENGATAVGGVVDPDVDRAVSISVDGSSMSEDVHAGGSVLTVFPDGGEIRLFDGDCLAFAGSVLPREATSEAELPSELESTARRFLAAVQEREFARAENVSAYPSSRLGERLSDSLMSVGRADWFEGRYALAQHAMDLVTSDGRLSIVAADVRGDTHVVAYTLVHDCSGSDAGS